MIPSLFDKKHLQLSKIRAEKLGVEPFIFERVTTDTQERLLLIQREFSTREEWPVTGGNYDLITSTLALQAVDDVVGQLIQIRLALKPDGLFMGSLLGSETLQELRLAFLEAEAELALPHTPHVVPFMDVKTAGTLLQRAGFALPVVESEIITLKYSNLMRLFEDLRKMAATNCLLSRTRHFMRRALFLKMLALYAEKKKESKHIVTLEILHLMGWSPHVNQQKPLEPGSVPRGFNALPKI